MNFREVLNHKADLQVRAQQLDQILREMLSKFEEAFKKHVSVDCVFTPDSISYSLDDETIFIPMLFCTPGYFWEEIKFEFPATAPDNPDFDFQSAVIQQFEKSKEEKNYAGN